MVDINRMDGVVQKVISDGVFTMLAVGVELGLRKRAIGTAVRVELFSI